MKLFEMLVANPTLAAVGWTLLHSLWEGVVIAALLKAMLLIFRTSRARYLAACAALLSVVVFFTLTLLRLAPESARSFPVRNQIAPVWNTLAENISSGNWRLDLAASAPWLALLWMAGVFLMLGRYFASCMSVRRFRSRGVCSPHALWQGEMKALAIRLHISRKVHLLESCLAEVPTVIGHFRPLILIPIGMLAGLPPNQVESILLHELAHIRRHDYLINTLQRCVETVLFYHPAVWWISAVIRREREHCCDDVVVSISGDPHEYARALAGLEQSRFSSAAVAATGGSLVKRIHRLLYPRTGGAWAPFVGVLIVVVMAAATVSAWPAKSTQTNSELKQSETEKALDPAYSKWLNEDVVYIIDQTERTAFQRLTTNEERDKFVAQFWERRNPTPGAPNQFKEEHYRRIAYTNLHFASGVPGWKTDRGHIYILYGPPDELEAHPHAAVPKEEWLYQNMPGFGKNSIFTFVDSTGRGDYRLSPGAPFVEKQASSGEKHQ